MWLTLWPVPGFKYPILRHFRPQWTGCPQAASIAVGIRLGPSRPLATVKRVRKLQRDGEWSRRAGRLFVRSRSEPHQKSVVSSLRLIFPLLVRGMAVT